MRNPSLITTELEVDDPLVQDADFEFDADDRQYIDNQIRGCEQHLVEELIDGIHATYITVDASSPDLVAGDVVCSASSTIGVPTMTKALSSPLAAAGAVLGVMLVAAAPGSKGLVALSGIIPPSVTGLGAVSGAVKVDTATGRCTQEGAFVAADFIVGSVDAQGYLTLAPAGFAYPSIGGGGGGGTVDAQSGANYTLNAGDKGGILAMTTANSQVNLPASPANADTYTVVYRQVTGTLTVSGNGNSIAGPAGGLGSETLSPAESATYTWFGTVNSISLSLWLRTA